jgi:hypothetical protein
MGCSSLKLKFGMEDKSSQEGIALRFVSDFLHEMLVLVLAEVNAIASFEMKRSVT